ncbi:MAG: ribonuclease HI [Clostridiales Family XIII bacterium]|jgi:ribonuclease HI|nr:ribonuclease HI [Clostridiales Family XIII bacterium]
MANRTGKPNTVHIYADGACSGNQHEVNTGGWGALLEYGPHIKELFGGESNTTNNRMELMALISAFEALTADGLRIDVYSDSSYVVNCLKRRWYAKWRTNGWLTSAKTPVENRDLWERLLSLTGRHECHYYLIKGHLNLNGAAASLAKAYAQFRKNNGDMIDYEAFLRIAEMNGRADELANKGIDKIRSETGNERV